MKNEEEKNRPTEPGNARLEKRLMMIRREKKSM